MPVASLTSPTPPRLARLPVRVLALLALPLAACGETLGPDAGTCGAPLIAPGVTLRSGFTPESRVVLAPGERCTLRDEDVRAFEIEASSASALYLLAVVSASEVPGAVSRLRLEIRPEGGVASGPAPSASEGGADGVPLAGNDRELRLRRNAREALRRAGARPARRGHSRAVGQGRVASMSLGGIVVPAVGDTVRFRNSVDADLAVDCERTDEIVGIVRAVGEQMAVVEDVDVSGHLSPDRHAGMLAALESFVFPVDTAYFGPPADLDGNGRVWALLTAVVNRATPRGSGTFIAGFFNPTDLSDPRTCPASNEAEVIYLLGPDPSGVFSDPVGVDFAVRNAIGVSAHELEHLISAESRVVEGGGGFADLEDAWLGEGLAHTAETVVGFRAAGLRPREDHGFAALTADADAFNSFHLANFRRAGFFLKDPAGTLALGDATASDPGGVPSLEMRGFAWLFLRWLADRGSPSGPGILGGPAEEGLFRDLASGGRPIARGVANVERATSARPGGGRWRDLLAGWALAPLADGLVDDAAGVGLATFDLRDVFAGLNGAFPERDPFTRPYPLDVTAVDLEQGGVFEFDLRASTARYFTVASARSGGGAGFGLTTPGGGSVPSGVRPDVVVMRIR